MRLSKDARCIQSAYILKSLRCIFNNRYQIIHIMDHPYSSGNLPAVCVCHSTLHRHTHTKCISMHKVFSIIYYGFYHFQSNCISFRTFEWIFFPGHWSDFRISTQGFVESLHLFNNNRIAIVKCYSKMLNSEIKTSINIFWI